MHSIHYKIITLRYQIYPENAIDFANHRFPKRHGEADIRKTTPELSQIGYLNCRMSNREYPITKCDCFGIDSFDYAGMTNMTKRRDCRTRLRLARNDKERTPQ